MRKLILPILLLFSTVLYALDVHKTNSWTGKDDIVFSTEVSSTVAASSNFVAKIVYIDSMTKVDAGLAARPTTVELNAVKVSTGLINTDLQTVKVSTGLINTSLLEVKVSTGIHKIIAGDNITISPATGIGDVTINASTAPTSATDTDCRGSTGTILGLIDALPTKAEADTYYLAIDSGSIVLPWAVHDSSMALIDTAVASRLDASSSTVLETLIASKLSASSGTIVVPALVFIDSMTKVDSSLGARVTNAVFIDSMTKIDANFIPRSLVWYTTSSIFASFADSTTVNLIGNQAIVRVPFDATLKNWFLVADATGSATVAITTGMITGTGLTFGGANISAALSTTQYATGAASGTIPRGYFVKFIVSALTTCKELYVSLEVWKKQ